MSYSDIVATIAMIVAIVAVPASGIISYHYAIKGEKRKEFNSAADLVRQKLYAQIRLIEQGQLPETGNTVITDNDFDSLLWVTKKSLVPGLDQAISGYQNSLLNSVEKNQYYSLEVTKPDHLIKSIEDLLPYVERK